MEVKQTFIEGLKVIIPDVFGDKRGYFFEAYSLRKFKDMGIDTVFVQDNESMSSKNVLRGLHFQKPPYAQDKLVRVVSGAVYDVAVDLRKDSPTYGKHFAAVLSGENKHMLYIPKGFAHGFLTLEDNTVFAYKCSEFYNKQSEGGIMWNDKDLNIDWHADNPVISEKDTKNISFKDFVSPF
ncbi:MAG: dTDP-4-dehydrorhamnose 3,5-epimerase [Bacteroidales bacterium]|nr:dTDP-4-dehydrorhamnose 3,5-epimerase [Bacteroidales bacterium]